MGQEMNAETRERMLTLAVLAWVALRRAATVGLWRPEQYGIVGMGLHVLLEILGSLKSLAAEVALVRF